MDKDLIAAVSDVVNVPVIASGGVGETAHIIEAVEQGADAIAIADTLHYQRTSLAEIHQAMRAAGLSVRQIEHTLEAVA